MSGRDMRAIQAGNQRPENTGIDMWGIVCCRRPSSVVCELFCAHCGGGTKRSVDRWICVCVCMPFSTFFSFQALGNWVPL